MNKWQFNPVKSSENIDNSMEYSKFILCRIILHLIIIIIYAKVNYIKFCKICQTPSVNHWGKKKKNDCKFRYDNIRNIWVLCIM